MIPHLIHETIISAAVTPELYTFFDLSSSEPHLNKKINSVMVGILPLFGDCFEVGPWPPKQTGSFSAFELIVKLSKRPHTKK
jgi:hypothetical protein